MAREGREKGRRKNGGEGGPNIFFNHSFFFHALTARTLGRPQVVFFLNLSI